VLPQRSNELNSFFVGPARNRLQCRFAALGFDNPLNRTEHGTSESFAGLNDDSKPIRLRHFEASCRFLMQVAITLQPGNHTQDMGLGTRVHPGTFVQNAVDRCPAKTGRCDDVTNTEWSLGAHVLRLKYRFDLG
jgi:hypothetical protein